VRTVWIAVAAVGVATIALKAVGPVFLRGRELPPRLEQMIDLLAPVLLAALVVTQTVGGDHRLEVDERLLGLAAAGIALALRTHLLVVPLVAAVVTAAARVA
jgi:branched-subunit amino acid transport protein